MTREEAVIKALAEIDGQAAVAEVRLEQDLFGAGYSFEAIASAVTIGRAMYAEQRPRLIARLHDILHAHSAAQDAS